MTFRKAVEAHVVIERLSTELDTLQQIIMSSSDSNTVREKAGEAWEKLEEKQKFELIKINEE